MPFRNGEKKMDFRHVLIMVGVLALGFWLGKKYPSALAGIPGVNAVLG